MKRAQLQEQKCAEADERQEAYERLTLHERYDRAIARGHWRSREAKRLRAALKAAA